VTWWNQIRVRHKVLVVLAVLLGPLLSALIFLVYLMAELIDVQEHRQDLLSVREEIRELRRITIDIEDAFRGYLLTEQDKFLVPLRDSEVRLPSVVMRTNQLIGAHSELAPEITAIERRISNLLSSKNDLIGQVKNNNKQRVHQFVHEGKGLDMSDKLRSDLRVIEDRLDSQIASTNNMAAGISEQAYWSVLLAALGALALGMTGSRMLAASITQPLTILQRATQTLGRKSSDPKTCTSSVSEIVSRDEIGLLARSYEEMNRRILQYIEELETLQSIGHEINTIAPDGVEGVLLRISNRAAELVHADVCLVLLRDEQMGCWVIEAASGQWHDRLRKTILLWEEFPICVRAFQTGKSAAGSRLRTDQRPELSRRNLIGDSMLSVPLLGHGRPFGVLALLSERHIEPDAWNDRLALGLAQAAAVAISNARVYEVVSEKRKGMRARLQQLEQMAEMLAHDLKGPGQRMGELAITLRHQYANQLDARGKKWLALLEQNGRDLTDRVEGILQLAQVGAPSDNLQAVNPTAVIEQILKSRIDELESLGAVVNVQKDLPLVAGQSAYIRQIFDNLLSNALKFARPSVAPEITIEASRLAELSVWTVKDNGIGIPPALREKVFMPFVRLDPSGPPGSGIGLTIVQRIVQLYHGKIWIEPSQTPGVIFRFTLPILHHWESESSNPDTTYRSQPLSADARRGKAQPQGGLI
jgi:signal transduction histidine kinase/CHASE3 domain sensor protein